MRQLPLFRSPREPGNRPGSSGPRSDRRLFRQQRYELKPLLEGLFLSKAFWDPRHRATLVRSPVDLIVGTLRVLEGKDVNGIRLAAQGRRMGQDLFDPPNVKGWPGGIQWVTSATLIVRDQYVQSLFSSREKNRPRRSRAMPRGRDRMGVTVDLEAWTSRLSDDPDGAVLLAARLLLPCPGVISEVKRGTTGRRALSLMSDPVFQLK